jgi:F0F1-type ATP synthase assembly protein I
MKKEAKFRPQLGRTDRRLGYSLAAGFIVGAILGALVDNILLGLSMGGMLGLVVGLIVVERGQIARLRAGDPERQRAIVLVISLIIYLLCLGLLWSF